MGITDKGWDEYGPKVRLDFTIIIQPDGVGCEPGNQGVECQREVEEMKSLFKTVKDLRLYRNGEGMGVVECRCNNDTEFITALRAYYEQPYEICYLEITPVTA